MEKVKKQNSINFILDVLKGTIFSIVFSMILIILFAIVIRFANINDNLILPINQVIKGVSLFFGTFLSLKGSNKGFFKGLLIGVFYSIISYIIFSILSSSMDFSLTLLTDLLFNSIIAGIAGLIVVNISRK